MSFGDPDNEPGMQRQSVLWNSSYEKLVFDMRCHGCNVRLVKETALVPRPVAQETWDFYKAWYEAVHLCDACQ